MLIVNFLPLVLAISATRATSLPPEDDSGGCSHIIPLLFIFYSHFKRKVRNSTTTSNYGFHFIHRLNKTSMFTPWNRNNITNVNVQQSLFARRRIIITLINKPFNISLLQNNATYLEYLWYYATTLNLAGRITFCPYRTTITNSTIIEYEI
jgi:hypothetical protein